MKKTILAMALVVTATTSFAWGDREQGALLGLIIGGHIVAQHQQAQVYVQPPPVYYQAPPVYIQQPPVYYQVPQPVYVQPPVVYLQDGTRLTYSYQSGLWVDSQNRAYNLPR